MNKTRLLVAGAFVIVIGLSGLVGAGLAANHYKNAGDEKSGMVAKQSSSTIYMADSMQPVHQTTAVTTAETTEDMSLDSTDWWNWDANDWQAWQDANADVESWADYDPSADHTDTSVDTSDDVVVTRDSTKTSYDALLCRPVKTTDKVNTSNATVTYVKRVSN